MNDVAPIATYYSRTFLNDEGVTGMAAVVAGIQPGDQSDEYLDFGATLEISEDGRGVSFDFGVYGATGSPVQREELRAELVNARNKAHRLQAEINAFVASLTDALDTVENDLIDKD
jgi:hypothetical protein